MAQIKCKEVLNVQKFSIGYTIESKFYIVENLPIKKINFFYDNKLINVDNGLEKIEIDFENVKSIHYFGDTMVIKYKYSPRVKNGNQLVIYGGVISAIDICTAITWKMSSKENNFLNLISMIERFDIDVSEFNYSFETNTIKPNFMNNCNSYLKLCIKSLGYPGLYMLQNFRCNEEHVLNNIYWHIVADRHLATISFSDYNQQSNQNQLLNENYVMIKSAIITPTKIIFRPPVLAQSNYAFRHKDVDTKKIISVKFVNHDFKQMNGNEKIINQKVKTILNNGIKVCRKRYNFFICSSSKFRENSAYLLEASKEEILKIYKSFGEFKSALPAKLGARVGQNATSVRIGLPPKNFTLMEDIVENGHNFTDGCGLISHDFAKELAEKFGLKNVPSAFQIRFPGFKGVLALHLPNRIIKDEDNNECDIVFTQEMEKFYGNCDESTTLDVIKYSSPSSLNLNKHFIEILCQMAEKIGGTYKNQIENRMTILIKEAFFNALENCIDEDKFMESLDNLPKYMDYAKMDGFSKAEKQAEPFLRSLVQADSFELIKKLNEKQRIPIPISMGRTMIGIPDIWEFLEPNQVFVSYTETLNIKCKTVKILEGKIGVTRSPLYDLGGIQFVEAVDVPGLRHLRDVIVFPTKGKIPIQKQLAKGDNDGDEYSVFWDPELLLPESFNSTLFPDPSPEPKFLINIDQLQEKYPLFFGDYMFQRFVGSYSNNLSFMAEEFGYDNSTVKQLVEKNEHALNYFKSGIKPQELEKHENSAFKPQHSRINTYPLYRLNNVLSSNHQFLEDKYLKINDIIKNDDSCPYVDEKIVYYLQKFEAKDIDEYMEKAKNMYEKFTEEIKRLQHQYHASEATTGQVFSGKSINFKMQFSSFEDNDPITSLAGMFQELVFNIMKKFREKFLDEYGDNRNWRQQMRDNNCDIFSFYVRNPSAKLELLAAACYKVAYEDGKCLAFPWTLWDVIDHIRRESSNNVGSSFFELHVYNEGNPRFAGKLHEDEQISDIFGLLHHLKDHTRMIYLLDYDELLDSFRQKYLMQRSIDSYQKRLSCVTLFIKAMGFLEEDVDPHVKEICSDLYMKIAFKKYPEIFGKSYKIDTSYMLQKFVVKIDSQLDGTVIDKLKKTSGCQITYRESGERYNKKIRTYNLLAYGNTAAILKLQNILAIRIMKNENQDVEKRDDNKIKILTQTLNSL